VPELCCADGARQIEGALGRLDGVREVRALVGSRTTLVWYDETRIGPEVIKGAVQSLGMTVTEARTPGAARGRSLADRLGWAFVSAVALIALLGIVGERLGLAEAVAERLPGWLSVAVVLVGSYPIFRAVARALRHRQVTSHALMTLGIIGALAIGQFAAGA